MGRKRDLTVDPEVGGMIERLSNQIANLATGMTIPKRGTVQDALYERAFVLVKAIGLVGR